MIEQLGSIFRRERDGLGFELGLSGGRELGWRRGSSGNGHSYFLEEVFEARGRAEAQQADWLRGSVAELVRRVGGNVDGISCVQGQLLTAEGDVDFAFEDAERLFEVVTMWRRAAARRDVHIDQTEATVGIVAGDKERVGISDDADVR